MPRQRLPLEPAPWDFPSPPPSEPEQRTGIFRRMTEVIGQVRRYYNDHFTRNPSNRAYLENAIQEALRETREEVTELRRGAPLNSRYALDEEAVLRDYQLRIRRKLSVKLGAVEDEVLGADSLHEADSRLHNPLLRNSSIARAALRRAATHKTKNIPAEIRDASPEILRLLDSGFGYSPSMNASGMGEYSLRNLSELGVTGYNDSVSFLHTKGRKLASGTAGVGVGCWGLVVSAIVGLPFLAVTAAAAAIGYGAYKLVDKAIENAGPVGRERRLAKEFASELLERATISDNLGGYDQSAVAPA